MEPRKPLLQETDIANLFVEYKYSCQLIQEPSWFHTILIKGFNIYIEEWMDGEDEEICATVFTGENKNVNGFANTNLTLLLNDVEEFIKKHKKIIL